MRRGLSMRWRIGGSCFEEKQALEEPVAIDIGLLNPCFYC